MPNTINDETNSIYHYLHLANLHGQDSEKAFINYKKAADCGHVDSQYYVAYQYDVKQDYLKALKYYRKAAAQQHESAISRIKTLQDEAEKLYKQAMGLKCSTQEVKYFESAAKLGHKNAQYFLASRYARGLYVEKNSSMAMKWYKKSADQGVKDAQFELAELLKKGSIGIPANEIEAVKYYRLASKQGHLEAQKLLLELQLKLGIQYFTGKGLPQPDKFKAAVCFVEASVLGSPSAQNYLGIMIEAGSGGLEQNYTMAASLYKSASSQGIISAHFNLADCYEKGLGVKKNVLKAIRLYTKAATNRHEKSQAALVRLKQDAKQGNPLIQQAFNTLDSEANSFNTQGVDYALGRNGAKKDINKAIEHYTQAAERGSQYAQYNLAVLFLSGRSVKKDEDEALRFFHLSAEAGFKDAQYLLGRLYEKKAKYTEARIWYLKAKQQGHRRARYRLSRLDSLQLHQGWKHEIAIKKSGKKTALIVSEESSQARHLAEKIYNHEKIAEFRAVGNIVRVEGGLIDYLIEYNNCPENPVMTIAFRGSVTLWDDFVKTNGEYPHRSLEEIDRKDRGVAEQFIYDVVAIVGEHSAHGGFIKRYSRMQDHMHADINKLIHDHHLAYSDVYFIFSGHSLGGAIASLAARDFKMQHPESGYIGLITVSSPRVYGTNAAQETERLLGKKNIMRWWRSGDIVTAVPPASFGFEHIGMDYMLKPLMGAGALDLSSKHNIELINQDLAGETWRQERNPFHVGLSEHPGIFGKANKLAKTVVVRPVATIGEMSYTYARIGLNFFGSAVKPLKNAIIESVINDHKKP
ncbi:TPR repeat protein [Legionella moravica]|uniref:TPR repeat protein n=1 Tax=Legionella moravica TaxID=39962 RepID=A0A378JYX6_9GAMM|nr:SEL1-like repeat protein [Legionella moravica]KTD34840.1 TPR repeat protein [Legionella moravica]STX63915.1 TPR repeat protein [Legionella moravica]